MFKIEIQKHHSFAACTFQRVIIKSEADGCAPLVKTSVNTMFLAGYGAEKFFVNFPVACVNAAIADHFVMLFRDVPDEAFNEFHNRECFFHICIIFVTVVMEGNKIPVIFINSGGGNDGTPQITPDVFDGSMGVAFAGFGVNVEAVFMLTVTKGFYLLKEGPIFNSISFRRAVRNALRR